MTLCNSKVFLAFLLAATTNLLLVNAQGIYDSQCAIDANQTFWKSPNSSSFLYDIHGKLTRNMSEAFGISYKACKDICRTPVHTKNYDWNALAQGLTSWLLPWLALTAQLPFETKDKQTNFMALLLALGSPSLGVFSLTLTILNCRWINQTFRHVGDHNKSLRPLCSLQTKAIKAARVFLIESQNIPIQVFNGSRRELAQLVVCPENWIWWCSLRKEIQKTKREWTYSLYAQVGWVCGSQLVAIVYFFTSASFDTGIGVGLAINSLWIWMIPVILGWVYVGTQTSAGSIKAGLTSVAVPVLGPERDVDGECIGIQDRTIYDESCTRTQDPRHFSPGPAVTSQSSQTGDPFEHFPLEETSLFSKPVDTKSADQEQRLQPLLEDEHQFSLSHSNFLGFSIAGCELEPGPVFNYARIWSHMNSVQHVAEAFSTFTRRQKARQPVHGQSWNEEPGRWDENFRGSPEEQSRYISAYGEDIINFTIHGTASSRLVLNCIVAAFASVFLQWGSTGGAMIISYMTPTVGLGCHSGSYLIYGLASTVAWLTLTLSAILSNRWSFQTESKGVKPHCVLGPLAVITRLAGKSLAAANAIFLVITSVFQFTGIYDTCWCNACIPSLGPEAGWVVLFASAAEIAAASKGAWIGGVLMSVLSAAFITFFFLVSRGDEIIKHNRQ